MSVKLIECDCGCGRKTYHNKLVEIAVETAIDKNLRRTKTSKRFWVTPACKEPYEQELALMLMLEKLVMAWAPKQKTWRQRIDIFLTFYNWIRRINAARQVMRMTHAIWVRNYGFEYARIRATNSAILFGAPRFMQGFLARKFTARLAKATARIVHPQ